MSRIQGSALALVVLQLACDPGSIGSSADCVGTCSQPAAVESPAARLRARLETIQDSDQFVFGMQRFNLTGVDASGVQWLGSETSLDRSDVDTLVGSHPGVLGVDVWDLAMKPDAWTPTPAAHAEAMKEVHARGGIVTLDWHMRGCNSDELGGGFAAAGNETCLCKLANDDAYASEWLDHGRLDKLADAIVRYGLEDVPIVFRPLHEMTGGWFWWGYPYWDCATLAPGSAVTGPEAYRVVFRRMVDYLRETRGLDNLVVAYAPDKLGSGVGATEEERYLAGYPGDAHVDVLGIDLYYLADQDFDAAQETFARYLGVVSRLARQKGKIAAVTEIGDYRLASETTPEQARWFSDHLLPLLLDPGVDVAYMLTWENRKPGATEFYVPYEGHAGVDDFKAFAASPAVLLLDDLAGGPAPPPSSGDGGDGPPPTAPLPPCTANQGLGFGETFACGELTCAKTDATYADWCVVQTTAPGGLPYCTANDGQGFGTVFACGELSCAKTDTTYVDWCVVR